MIRLTLVPLVALVRAAVGAALVAAALGAGCTGAIAEHEIAAERDGGVVRVRTHRDWQHVEVTSPKGIGAARVPLARPPRPLRLIFHLRALEQLRFTYDDVEIVVAVPATGAVRESVRHAGGDPGAGARDLAPGDPDWMPVTIVPDSTGSPRIEIGGPAVLMIAAPASFHIEWVDFFR